MSEREPITAELRGKMDTLGWYDEDGNIVFTTGGTPVSEIACLAINSKTFGELCDAIDAVHAGLERENAELRQRLAVLDKRSESMHDGSATVTITDELRKWMDRTTIRFDDRRYLLGTDEELTAIADRIDAEHEAQLNDAFETRNSDENLESDGWVRLPLDADGVPIHVGERVQLIGNDPSTVSHMSLAGDGWRVYVKYDGDLGTGSGEPSRIRHHHAPTVEDVLVKMLEKAVGYSDAHTTVALNAIAEYAAKLRLAGDAE